MPASAQRSLTKPLEPSSTAAALDGPSAWMPAASSTSHNPPTSWASAPITAKSIFWPIGEIRQARRNRWPGSARIRATCGDSGIAGRAIELGQQGAGGQGPGQRMFPAPRSHQEKFHAKPPHFAAKPCIIPRAMSEAATISNLPEFSVSELSGALKRTVEENFAFVRVRGEISGLKFHSSGHIYFDLKDDKAVPQCRRSGSTGAARLKLQARSGAWKWSAPGGCYHLSRLLALPDHRRADGTGGAGRADGDAGGAQASGSPPKACSMPRARRSCPSCPR